MVRHPRSLRLLQALILGYLLLAIFTRVREARGVYRCGCDDDYRCKQPGLSLSGGFSRAGTRTRSSQRGRRRRS